MWLLFVSLRFIPSVLVVISICKWFSCRTFFTQCTVLQMYRIWLIDLFSSDVVLSAEKFFRIPLSPVMQETRFVHYSLAASDCVDQKMKNWNLVVFLQKRAQGTGNRVNVASRKASSSRALQSGAIPCSFMSKSIHLSTWVFMNTFYLYSANSIFTLTDKYSFCLRFKCPIFVQMSMRKDSLHWGMILPRRFLDMLSTKWIIWRVGSAIRLCTVVRVMLVMYIL